MMNYSRLAPREESHCAESSAHSSKAQQNPVPPPSASKLGISIPSASVLAAKPNGSRRAPRFRKVAIPETRSQAGIRTPAYLDLLPLWPALNTHPASTPFYNRRSPHSMATSSNHPTFPSRPYTTVLVALAHPPPRSRTRSTRPPASAAPRQRRNSTARRSG